MKHSNLSLDNSSNDCGYVDNFALQVTHISTVTITIVFQPILCKLLTNRYYISLKQAGLDNVGC